MYRFLSRIFGVDLPIDSAKGKKEFKRLAQSLIHKEQPGTFNQAIMEFGARQCIPQNPKCDSCVFNDKCIALKDGIVGVLPVKKGRQKIKKRYFNYLVVHSENNRTILVQRKLKGIWQKLYEFPLIESKNKVDVADLKSFPKFKELVRDLSIESLTLYNESSIVHKLSTNIYIPIFGL